MAGRRKIHTIKRHMFTIIFILIVIVAAAAVIYFMDIFSVKTIISDKLAENETTELSDDYTIIGCIKYTDYYLYFDEDGIVRSTSDERDEDVTLVTGLSIESVALNEVIPIEDDSVFSWIVEVVQTMEKYELDLDKIYISEDLEMTLYIGDVKVELGTDDQTVEKITELSNFYDDLDGLSGTLYMQDFDLENKTFTFESDDE